MFKSILITNLMLTANPTPKLDGELWNLVNCYPKPIEWIVTVYPSVEMLNMNYCGSLISNLDRKVYGLNSTQSLQLMSM